MNLQVTNKKTQLVKPTEFFKVILNLSKVLSLLLDLLRFQGIRRRFHRYGRLHRF